MRELTPIEEFEKIIRRWWWVAVLTLVGGLLGWGAHFLLPPVYEARSVIVVDVDFQQTGPLEELEQDQLVWAAIHLFYSKGVIAAANEAAADEYPRMKPLVPLENAIIERRRSELYLTVRGDHAEAAAFAANRWAEAAYAALQQAHQNAVDAFALREYIAALETCPAAPQETTVTGFCGQFTPQQIQAEVALVSAQIEHETQASAGIVPAIGYTLGDPAETPASPVSYNRWLMMMGGALIGFVVGALAAAIYPQKGRPQVGRD